MSNSATTPATLMSPLTLLSLTASRVAGIDASKTLYSIDEAVFKLSSSITDFTLLGTKTPSDTTNTRIILSGNTRSINPGSIAYVATGASGAHFWLTTDSGTERMRLNDAGNLSVAGTLSATPKYYRKFQNVNQTIAAASETVLINWGSGSGTGPLTTGAISFINNTGAQLTVLFTYSIYWDPAVGGGVVEAALITNQSIGVPWNGDRFGKSTAQVIPATYNCSCSGSAIIIMNNGDDVALWVRNNLGGNLDVKGGSAGQNNTSQMYYYILN